MGHLRFKIAFIIKAGASLLFIVIKDRLYQ